MARVEFRRVPCTGGTWVYGCGPYLDSDSWYTCSVCGVQEEVSARRPVPPREHARPMPEWAVCPISRGPGAESDPGVIAWWRAMVEIAALSGEDLGVVVLDDAAIEAEERWEVLVGGKWR